jgi:hypothetical protein
MHRRVQLAVAAVFVVAAVAAPAAVADEASPLTVAGPDSPTLRLQQTADQYPEQVWDLLGNEQTFSLKDVTHGGRFPLRIGAGAPTHSLVVESNGNVGLGAKVDTSGPTPTVVPTPSSLYVYRNDGTAKAMVEERDPETAPRVLGELQNNGPVQLRFSDAGPSPTSWLAGTDETKSFVLRAGSANALTVAPGGDVRTAGAQDQSLDGTVAFAAVDPQQVLEGIKKLPAFASWEYANDPDHARHLTPSSDDLKSLLGLGTGGAAIAPVDLAGAALAGVRALADIPPGSDPRVTPAIIRITGLEARAKTAETKVKTLEKSVKTLTSDVKKLKSSDKKQAKAIAALQKQVKALAKRR